MAATPNSRKTSPAGKAVRPTKPAGTTKSTKAPKAGKSSKPTGFMNWLGRQVGHVKKAMKTDVTTGPAKPVPNVKPTAKPAATATPSADASAAPKVVYRTDKVEEVEHPTQPGVILRRTIVDEVIVEGAESDGGDGSGARNTGRPSR